MFPKNLAVLLPLMSLSQESIQYIKDFKNSPDHFDFINKYDVVKIENLSDGLWLSSRLIIGSPHRFTESSLVLFTDNDQPHAPGSVEFQKIFVRAKDLLDNDMNVTLVPMVDDFDTEKYYKEFLCTVSNIELEEFQMNSPEDQRQILLNRVYHKHYRSMCQRYLNVVLGEDLKFSCGIYSFTKIPKIPSSVKIWRNTNELVVAKRTYMIEEFNEDTNEMEFTHRIMPGDLFKCQEIGGKEVIFKPEEITRMNSLVPPGIRVLGFKPLDNLQERYFVKKVAFLYPADNRIKGSAKLFRALWERCLAKKKYMLCVLMYKRKGTPRYVALVPQSSEPHGHDGFQIVFLPMSSKLKLGDRVYFVYRLMFCF